MGAEDLAEKLEKAVRENRKVVLEMPDQGPAPEIPTQEAQAPPAIEPALDQADAPSDAPIQPVGIKVRLRDKLSVLGQ